MIDFAFFSSDKFCSIVMCIATIPFFCHFTKRNNFCDFQLLGDAAVEKYLESSHVGVFIHYKLDGLVLTLTFIEI